MKEKDKYVYILTSDKPIEKELNLFRACRQEQIFALRSCLSNEEILRLINTLKRERYYLMK